MKQENNAPNAQPKKEYSMLNQNSEEQWGSWVPENDDMHVRTQILKGKTEIEPHNWIWDEKRVYTCSNFQGGVNWNCYSTSGRCTKCNAMKNDETWVEDYKDSETH